MKIGWPLIQWDFLTPPPRARRAGPGRPSLEPRLRASVCLEAMAKTDTQTVARREYAQRASLRGGNPYRVKAYLRAADSLSALSQPLDQSFRWERYRSSGTDALG